MARNTGPQCKLCRREGTQLFLKGSRCDSAKCAISKREYPPGQHAWRRRKSSEYGRQLREKQKVKRHYGVLDRQFRIYFLKAEKQKGNTGENLMKLLESRLDSVVYRMGAALSRAHARQIITHGHIMVNGRKIDIPSYLVKQGDSVTPVLKENSVAMIMANLETTKGKSVPSWIDVTPAPPEGRIVGQPNMDELSIQQVEPHLLVEICSK